MADKAEKEVVQTEQTPAPEQQAPSAELTVNDLGNIQTNY